MKSASEEILSTNEELQSTNEELQTAKEEAQSANEELVTVNEELRHRNAELNRVNNDLVNLLSGVNIPIVMVSRDLRIRRFTPLAEKVFNLIPTDVGRPISDIKSNLQNGELSSLITGVIDTVTPHEIEVQDRDGRLVCRCASAPTLRWKTRSMGPRSFCWTSTRSRARWKAASRPLLRCRERPPWRSLQRIGLIGRIGPIMLSRNATEGVPCSGGETRLNEEE